MNIKELLGKDKATQRRNAVRVAVITLLVVAFCYWVESWWGLLALPLLIDYMVTQKLLNWYWWRDQESPVVRGVMSWVDAILFAGVAVYFINTFFFQNYVIPSSSLEKSLLTGDYLLVSKLSYGPRIPQTPLTLPLTQHTLPGTTDTKSYLEWPQWAYRRVKGLGTIAEGDIVVFNYPSGDTVATLAQNQDFYTLCYNLGQGLAQTIDTTRGGYEAENAAYQHYYTLGREYVVANRGQFGNIIARPADRRENYVKRCVGLPGQTLAIKQGQIYIDARAQKQPDEVQFAYLVTFVGEPTDDFMKEHGISREDLSVQPDPAQPHLRLVPLTQRVKQVLEGRKDLVASITPLPDTYSTGRVYPLNKNTGWTAENYGPIYIPKKGATIALTLDNLPFYERPIRSYEGHALEVRQGQIYIDGKVATSYTFAMDYYWLMGDNRDNSADSRFWGFVPEDHIVGKPLFVWLSLDPDRSLWQGGIRWSRFLKWVDDIR